MANSQNGGAVQYGNLEPLADYPDARVLLVEEALPLIKEDAIEIVSYTKFYDEFLNTDKLQKTWPIVESSLREYGVLCTLDLAIRILDCSCQYEIIKIGNQEGGFCDIFGISKEQFLARRKLVISVLQGLLDLTGCGIFLKGNTVAVIGSLEGIKLTTKIVEDCIAHDVPPAPRVQRLKKKIQPKRDARIKMTSRVMMNLESLHV